MSDRVKKVEKIRLSLTLTRDFIDAIDHLVEKGIYLERQVAIRDFIRRGLQLYRIEPFMVPEPSEGPR